VSTYGSRFEPRDRFARNQRGVVTRLRDRVDDTSGVRAGRDVVGDPPQRVAGLDDVREHSRARARGCEGAPPERGARVAHRQHRAEPERHGGEPTPPIYGGGSVASRRTGTRYCAVRASWAALPAGTWERRGGFENRGVFQQRVLVFQQRVLRHELIQAAGCDNYVGRTPVRCQGQKRTHVCPERVIVVFCAP
jgi:hypothetical protein